jgi:murein peptide amidase A
MRQVLWSRALTWGVVATAFVMGAGPSAGVLPTVHQVPDRAFGQAPSSSPVRAMGSPLARQQIGTSVQNRPIYAFRMGDPTASVKAVVLGNMHGDEPAGIRVVYSILRSRPILGVDLWVVPTMNPDGVAAHTRQNANGVDLNRNWSYKWVHQTGTYNSGPRAFSEPESRAMRDFLSSVDPTFVVSFHQPLHGVDSDHPKNKHLMNRLSKKLTLPKKPFTCGGVCHGTMTGWFNFHRAGACITVEFGASPSRAYLNNHATTGTVRSVLGHYPPP